PFPFVPFVTFCSTASVFVVQLFCFPLPPQVIVIPHRTRLPLAWKLAMKRPLLLASLILLAVVATSAWSFYRRASSGEGMTAQATRFLETLSADQKKIALLPYDSESRVNWHFIPFFDKDGKPGRKGLQ